MWNVQGGTQLLFFSNPKEAFSGIECNAYHCIVSLPVQSVYPLAPLSTPPLFSFFPKYGSAGSRASPVVNQYFWESRWQSPASCHLTAPRCPGSGRAGTLLPHMENKCHVQRQAFWLIRKHSFAGHRNLSNYFKQKGL